MLILSRISFAKICHNCMLRTTFAYTPEWAQSRFWAARPRPARTVDGPDPSFHKDALKSSIQCLPPKTGGSKTQSFSPGAFAGATKTSWLGKKICYRRVSPFHNLSPRQSTLRTCISFTHILFKSRPLPLVFFILTLLLFLLLSLLSSYK